MMLPTNKLMIGDNEITVSRIEETNGFLADGRELDTALYRDNSGNFYVASVVQKTIEECARLANRKELTFPKDAELIESVRESKLEVSLVSERDALKWYVTEFMSEGPLKKRMSQVVSRFNPRDQRPAWPCCEKIGAITYDRENSEFIETAAAAGWGLYKQLNQPAGKGLFFALKGEPIIPCPSPGEAIEALILYRLSPRHFKEFAQYLPTLNSNSPQYLRASAMCKPAAARASFDVFLSTSLMREVKAEAVADNRTQDEQLELVLARGIAVRGRKRGKLGNKMVTT